MSTSASSSAGSGDLTLRNVVKTFGSFTAVDDLNLTVPRGSFFALLGPSGCGKTTTLRMVAGLEEPTSGRIGLGDLDITHTKPYRRPVNTVFQNYALFPHLDVFENVAFGLRRRGVRDVRREVEQALDLVELRGLARRKPAQLSGGQQQRIALARAVVNRPQVLLLDEPLGALDLKLRRQMQLELKRIQTEVGITFIHVTHDQEEAMTMADTVAVMNHGRIEQLGNPVELYESPRTTYVANFLGQCNLMPGTRTGDGDTAVSVEVHGQPIAVPAERAFTDRRELLIGVRPEKLLIVPRDGSVTPGFNRLLGGVVEDASFLGVSTQYQVRMPWGESLSVFAQNWSAGGIFPVGSAVTLAWEPDHTFGLEGDATSGIEVEGPSVTATVG